MASFIESSKDDNQLQPVSVNARSTSDKLDFTQLLSDETLCHILKFVETYDDYIRLSEVCERLNRILQDRQFCQKIRFQWHFCLSRLSVSRFFKDRIRVAMITTVDFSDMYWIPSSIICDLVIRMSSLEVLFVAGCPLSWVHLAEILNVLKLRKLSWSWDNNLEESVRKRSSISPTKYAELIELGDSFLRLKSLLIDIPMAKKVATDLLFYTYSSLVFMISMCQNLEELWILSWPKSHAERKCSSSFNRADFEDLRFQFDNLHTLVISIKDPPRFSSSSFIGKIVGWCGIVGAPKVFWLDHPLLAYYKQPVSSGRSPNHQQLRIDQWQHQLCSEKTEMLSYPLLASVEVRPKTTRLPSLKKVLINHGPPIVVGLQGILDDSPELESFCSTAINLKMDWQKFVKKHAKLKSVCIDETQDMGDFSIALSKLFDLEKLSVSCECLYEIRDSEALAEYSLNQMNSGTDEFKSCTQDEHQGEGTRNLFKKERVGVLSTSDRVTGLHLITFNCKKINEMEIGYSKINNSKAGRLIPNALSSISRLNFLTKLSLSSLPISSGHFLTQIFKSCKLESIRLTNLGPSGKCIYMHQLCEALCFCSSLQDFRLEQNYIGSTSRLFSALQKCPNLRRLVIWSSPNDSPLPIGDVEKLFEACSKLMVFYVAVEPTTKLACVELRKKLEKKYKRQRPALSVVIRSSLEEAELIHYPSVHYRQMVVNNAQVCQFIDFSDFASS